MSSNFHGQPEPSTYTDEELGKLISAAIKKSIPVPEMTDPVAYAMRCRQLAVNASSPPLPLPNRSRKSPFVGFAVTVSIVLVAIAIWQLWPRTSNLNVPTPPVQIARLPDDKSQLSELDGVSQRPEQDPDDPLFAKIISEKNEINRSGLGNTIYAGQRCFLKQSFRTTRRYGWVIRITPERTEILCRMKSEAGCLVVDQSWYPDNITGGNEVYAFVFADEDLPIRTLNQEADGFATHRYFEQWARTPIKNGPEIATYIRRSLDYWGFPTDANAHWTPYFHTATSSPN